MALWNLLVKTLRHYSIRFLSIGLFPILFLSQHFTGLRESIQRHIMYSRNLLKHCNPCDPALQIPLFDVETTTVRGPPIWSYFLPQTSQSKNRWMGRNKERPFICNIVSWSLKLGVLKSSNLHKAFNRHSPNDLQSVVWNKYLSNGNPDLSLCNDGSYYS